MMPNIAARIFNTPLAIEPRKAEAILNAIGPRLGVDAINVTVDAGAFLDVESECDDKNYEVKGGVAIIPIHGTLVQRGAWIGAYSGMTSYWGVRKCFTEAMNDSAVKAVFLDVDSPGGEVSGLFDLVDDMSRRVGEKPIHAHCNELSASAAYALTTVADHVSIPRTGTAGSVGVIIVHAEYSDYLRKEGVQVNIIRAGDHKAEGNPYEQLSKDARESLQGEVDYVREIFVKTVARNRGIDEKAIWDTEARVFTGPEAVRIGLADAVMSTNEAAAHLVAAMG